MSLHGLLSHLGTWAIATTSLGSATDKGSFFSQIVVPAAVLAALLIAAGIGVLMARKMLARPDTDDPGFTLHELKEMHQAGTLSDVEYRAARDALIANMTTNQDE